MVHPVTWSGLFLLFVDRQFIRVLPSVSFPYVQGFRIPRDFWSSHEDTAASVLHSQSSREKQTAGRVSLLLVLSKSLGNGSRLKDPTQQYVT